MRVPSSPSAPAAAAEAEATTHAGWKRTPAHDPPPLDAAGRPGTALAAAALPPPGPTADVPAAAAAATTAATTAAALARLWMEWRCGPRGWR